jgi:AmiR/NasT family two-component response regulator
MLGCRQTLARLGGALVQERGQVHGFGRCQVENRERIHSASQLIAIKRGTIEHDAYAKARALSGPFNERIVFRIG